MGDLGKVLTAVGVAHRQAVVRPHWIELAVAQDMVEVDVGTRRVARVLPDDERTAKAVRHDPRSVPPPRGRAHGAPLRWPREVQRPVCQNVGRVDAHRHHITLIGPRDDDAAGAVGRHAVTAL